METEPRAVAAGLRGVYDRQAVHFDQTRTRALYERGWLDRALAMTEPGSVVLDLGCGAGEPIAAYVVSQGRQVWGLDFSAAMIGLAAARMPEQTWMVADMRALHLGRTFAAIIGWDSFFHLTPPEQMAVIPKLAAHLEDGGAVLLTVGPDAGEPLGCVGGETVYHASLAPAGYRKLFADVGMAVIDFVPNDPGCGGRSVLLARKGG
ncbi:MAG: hypothetical protein B7Z10_07880 [Rhodobacterales bacterium 32-66-7]|nr:MAG: hypothetical protein B7Z10_07880 [Rhodobacterales bacterium 32-66-7]